MISKRTTLLILLAGQAAIAQQTGFRMRPERGLIGKTIGVTISSTNDKCVDDLTGAVLRAPTGSGVSVKPVPGSDGCNLTAELAIEASSAQADVPLMVVKGETVIFRPIFAVVVAVPGAVPPGIKPGVDVSWKVLPRKQAADSFGSRIAKLYYAVEVSLGNNSGYDLQVASISFQLKPPQRSSEKIVQPKGQDGKGPAPDDSTDGPMPNDSYLTVRSSLETEQQIGLRNTLVHVMNGIGPVLQGSAVFFKTDRLLIGKEGTSVIPNNRKATYQNIVGVFSNPFEKAFELVFPDKTVRHLVALDNRTLRDGMVIHNNQQVRTMVFFSREILEKAQSLNHSILRSRGRADFDPLYAKSMLGKLVLEGKEIEYIRRIHLIDGRDGSGIEPKPTVTGVGQRGPFDQGSTQKLSISGAFMKDAKLTVPGDPSVSVTEQTASESGGLLTATINIGDEAPVGRHALVVTAAGGEDTSGAWIEVKAAAPVVDSVVASGTISQGQQTELTVKGRFLGNLTESDITPGTSLVPAIHTLGRATDGGKQRSLTVKVADQADVAQPAKIRVGGKDFTIQIKRAAPTIDQPPLALRQGETYKEVNVKGKFLTGAVIDADSLTSKGLVLREQSVAPDGQTVRLTVEVTDTAPATTGAPAEFLIKGPDDATAGIKYTLERRTPEITPGPADIQVSQGQTRDITFSGRFLQNIDGTTPTITAPGTASPELSSVWQAAGANGRTRVLKVTVGETAKPLVYDVGFFDVAGAKLPGIKIQVDKAAPKLDKVEDISVKGSESRTVVLKGHFLQNLEEAVAPANGLTAVLTPANAAGTERTLELKTVGVAEGSYTVVLRDGNGTDIATVKVAITK